MQNNKYLKEFEDSLKSIARHKNYYEKFRDFVNFSFYSLSNIFYKDEDIEKQYLQLANTYTKEEMLIMSKLLGLLTLMMEDEPNDHLGTMLMAMGGGDEFKGQFFTPQTICDFMSKIVHDNIDSIIEEKGYITVNDPAVGAGAMIIGLYKHMLDLGYNPQTQMYVHLTDVCNIVYKMCYVQMSILGISGVIINGNSLTLEVYEYKKTPFHFINNWDSKFRFEELNSKINKIMETECKLETTVDETSKEEVESYSKEQQEIFKQGVLFI